MDSIAGSEFVCDVDPSFAATGWAGGEQICEESELKDEEENKKTIEEDQTDKRIAVSKTQGKRHARRAGGLLSLRFTIDGIQRGVEGESICGDWKGLQPATQLEVRVRAKNLSGWGQYSLAAFARTADSVPESPPAPKIVSISAVSAVLYWSAPPSCVARSYARCYRAFFTYSLSALQYFSA